MKASCRWERVMCTRSNQARLNSYCYGASFSNNMGIGGLEELLVVGKQYKVFVSFDKIIEVKIIK